MALTHATLWDTVKELVLEQYKDSVNLVSLIKTMVEECAQPLEDGAFSLQDFFNLDDAEGAWLDLLGKLVGLKRYGGESDTDFKKRIERATSNISAGTPDSVIYNAAINSGDPKPAYIDEADATFLVYTGPKPNKTVSEDSDETVEDFTAEERECVGGGNQLLRRQVQQTAPAGVLGLPGQAIHFADGGMMCDAQGRLFLAAFNDEDVDQIRVITDDQGRLITDGDGRVLTF